MSRKPKRKSYGISDLGSPSTLSSDNSDGRNGYDGGFGISPTFGIPTGFGIVASPTEEPVPPPPVTGGEPIGLLLALTYAA